MSCQPAVEFGPLDLSDRQGIWIVGDTVPDGFDKLNAVFNAQIQDLLKLARAHGLKSTLVEGLTQFERIAPGVSRRRRATVAQGTMPGWEARCRSAASRG